MRLLKKLNLKKYKKYFQKTGSVRGRLPGAKDIFAAQPDLRPEVSRSAGRKGAVKKAVKTAFIFNALMVSIQNAPGLDDPEDAEELQYHDFSPYGLVRPPPPPPPSPQLVYHHQDQQQEGMVPRRPEGTGGYTHLKIDTTSTATDIYIFPPVLVEDSRERGEQGVPWDPG